MSRRAVRAALVVLAVTVALAALPALAHACAMCKGSLDDPTARRVASGYALSVVTMLSVLFVMVPAGGLWLLHEVNPVAFAELGNRVRRLANRRTVVAAAAALAVFAAGTVYTLHATAVQPPDELPIEALAGKPLLRSGATLAQPSLERSALEGKVVIVTFFASWCGPCREQVKELEDLQRELGPKVQVVAANAFELSPDMPATRHVHPDGAIHYHPAPRPEMTVGQWLRQDGISLPVLTAGRAMLRGFGDVSRIPTTFVFGPQGQLVRQYVNDPVADFVRPDLSTLRADVAAALDH